MTGVYRKWDFEKKFKKFKKNINKIFSNLKLCHFCLEAKLKQNKFSAKKNLNFLPPPPGAAFTASAGASYIKNRIWGFKLVPLSLV